MTFAKYLAATATAALLATSATAQMFGEETRTDYDYNTFNTGFGESGYFEAWDQDGDGMLSENEFSTGVYADWDTDNDLQITESEWDAGAERWYGPDWDADYSTWDADGSGYLDQSEFGTNWDSDYYSTWDTTGDTMLDSDEFSTGLYNTADLDEDQVITIEEEGWFEGWFDGDDIEAEIRDVGEVY